LATSLGALLFFSSPRLSVAQSATLEQAEALLKNGQTAEARAGLETWKQHNSAATRSQASTARVTYLTARLATRADDAEESYLTIALSHPTSPYAAESLLRLGQARLASGDSKQALVYLQRLSADYPRSELRALGGVWLARAQLARGQAPAACTTLETALHLPRIDGETAALLRDEQATACVVANATQRGADPPVHTPPVSVPAAAKPPATRPAASPAAATGSYTIQVAAFRERAGALSVVRQLERKGLPGARLVRVPNSALIRVRLGRFENAAAAGTQLSKVKAAGFAPIVVADANREQAVRD
jgi:tetratricopeptide (TPR) repeat protein